MSVHADFAKSGELTTRAVALLGAAPLATIRTYGRASSIVTSRGEMSVDVVLEARRFVAAIPSWLQVLLFYYLAVVLGSWARGRFSEKRGFWLAAICLVVAVVLAARATAMLYAEFFEQSY